MKGVLFTADTPAAKLTRRGEHAYAGSAPTAAYLQLVHWARKNVRALEVAFPSVHPTPTAPLPAVLPRTQVSID